MAMRSIPTRLWLSILLAVIALPGVLAGAEAFPAPDTKLPPAGADKTIGAADLTPERVGDSIPASAIGEPVSAVKLAAARWVDAANGMPAYATVDGSILPVDPKAPRSTSASCSPPRGVAGPRSSAAAA